MAVCRERFPGRMELGGGHWAYCFICGEGTPLEPKRAPTNRLGHQRPYPQLVAEENGAISFMARIKLAYIGGGSTRPAWGSRARRFPLVLADGVFCHPTITLVDAIVARVRTMSPASAQCRPRPHNVARVRTMSPDIRPVRSRSEPIVGVLLQAPFTAGVETDQALLTRLIIGMPPALPLLHHPGGATGR